MFCFPTLRERATRMANPKKSKRVLICRPYITTRNGKRIYAAEHGLRAFCFYVDAEE